MKLKALFVACLALAFVPLLIKDAPPPVTVLPDVAVTTSGLDLSFERDIPIVGNPDALREQYEYWKTGLEGYESTPPLVLGLFWSKGRSKAPTEAHGRVSFDLVDWKATVEVSGLDLEGDLDVWLVENRQQDGGVTLRPEDVAARIGRLEREGDTAALETDIKRFDGFELDYVVVTRSGERPQDGGLLYGTPDLFQRLYSIEVSGRLDDARAREGFGLMGLALAAPMAPPASPPPGSLDDFLNDLVLKGEKIFFNETFSGNGRTCGTCHRAENNLTIDPPFIATLPEKDPLFVAEFNPKLNFEQNGGKRFENPILMRKFGLIVENLDGFGDLKNRFTMRGVPHVFSQNLSILPANEVEPPDHRTGWSGDGAPSGTFGDIEASGRLFDFAIGAVIQHFPKSTNRQAGIDFRLPTKDELTALEAFQRALGRQKELILDQMDPDALKLTDTEAQLGLELFIEPANRCNGCHNNAGANVASGLNRNFDTGVEEFLQEQLAILDPTGEPRPFDGGFGTNPQGDFTSLEEQPGFYNENFGNGNFNTASLVEFADTLPGFHNNIADTVEEGITFYASTQFAEAPNGGAPILLDDDEVRQVGKFLRAINAMDNIDSAITFAKRAANAIGSFTAPKAGAQHAAVNAFLRLAIADVDDSILVLEQVGMNPKAVSLLRDALCSFNQAMAPQNWGDRADLIEEGADRLQKAKDQIGE